MYVMYMHMLYFIVVRYVYIYIHVYVCVCMQIYMYIICILYVIVCIFKCISYKVSNTYNIYIVVDTHLEDILFCFAFVAGGIF